MTSHSEGASVREYLTAIGVTLMVTGALGTVPSVYHLQSARRDFIALFQPNPFRFCGTPDPPNEKMERFVRDDPPVRKILVAFPPEYRAIESAAWSS